MRFYLAELDGCRRRHGGMFVNPAFRQQSTQPLRARGPLVNTSAAALAHFVPLASCMCVMALVPGMSGCMR